MGGQIISTLYVFECKFYYLKVGYYVHEILYVIRVVVTEKIEKDNDLNDKRWIITCYKIKITPEQRGGKIEKKLKDSKKQ